MVVFWFCRRREGRGEGWVGRGGILEGEGV